MNTLHKVRKSWIAVFLSISLMLPSGVWATESYPGEFSDSVNGGTSPDITPGSGMEDDSWMTPGTYPWDIPDETPQTSPDNTTQNTTQNTTPQPTPDNTPENTPATTPDSGAEDTVESTPTTTTQNTQEAPKEVETFTGIGPVPNAIKLVSSGEDPRISFKKVEKIFAVAKTDSIVNVREEPSETSKVVGTCKQDNLVYILAEEGEWYYIESGDVRGFIHKEFLLTGIFAKVFVKQTGEDTMMMAEPAVERSDNKAYSYTETTVYQIGPVKGEQLIEYASRFVNTSYKPKGNSLRYGIDASHYVWRVLCKFDLFEGECPAMAEWPTLGKEVSSIEEAQVGDIVCYEKTVGFYLGEGNVLMAYPGVWKVTDNYDIEKNEILAIRRFTKEVEYTLIGASNAQKVFNYLVEKGWTQEAAAAAVGNMFQESGGGGSTDINPASHGSGGRGIAGFTFSPDSGSSDDGTGLVRYAQSVGKDWMDLQTQCDYLILCLSGRWGSMWNINTLLAQQLRSVGLDVPNISFQEFTKLKNVDTATLVFLSSYENCNVRDAATARRLMMARSAYQSYR